MQSIPEVVLIVPYRDRDKELSIFMENMETKLRENDILLLIIHQKDKRLFNRGAMKNIGFIVLKSLYPQDYGKITLVFNDVDICPIPSKTIEYKTERGTIKHFYGFKHTLGGIVSITGNDFEKLNGFPNLWTWGFEDTFLQKKAIINGIKIDRSDFFDLNEGNTSKHFISTQGCNKRDLSREELKFINRNMNLGLGDLKNLNYEIDDNFINVVTFTTSFGEPNSIVMDKTCPMTKNYLNQSKKMTMQFS